MSLLTQLLFGAPTGADVRPATLPGLREPGLQDAGMPVQNSPMPHFAEALAALVSEPGEQSVPEADFALPAASFAEPALPEQSKSAAGLASAGLPHLPLSDGGGVMPEGGKGLPSAPSPVEGSPIESLVAVASPRAESRVVAAQAAGVPDTLQGQEGKFQNTAQPAERLSLPATSFSAGPSRSAASVATGPVVEGAQSAHVPAPAADLNSTTLPPSALPASVTDGLQTRAAGTVAIQPALFSDSRSKGPMPAEARVVRSPVIEPMGGNPLIRENAGTPPQNPADNTRAPASPGQVESVALRVPAAVPNSSASDPERVRWVADRATLETASRVFAAELTPSAGVTAPSESTIRPVTGAQRLMMDKTSLALTSGTAPIERLVRDNRTIAADLLQAAAGDAARDREPGAGGGNVTQASGAVAESADRSWRSVALRVEQAGLTADFERVLEQVQIVRSRRLDGASLHLNLDELGPVEIKIRTEANQAHLQFVVREAATRDMLEGQLPKLRALLEQGGMDLGDFGAELPGRNDRQRQDAGRQLSELLPTEHALAAPANDAESRPAGRGDSNRLLYAVA